mmetsp:Transcript_18288/g.42668  ORF Transcript_18288/g.42668 Transcript_18288/m.42668 type:complete len:1184 (+) Transcript_18288:54-3605(+)
MAEDAKSDTPHQAAPAEDARCNAVESTEEQQQEPAAGRDRVRSSVVSDALREERKVQVTRERFEKGSEEVEELPQSLPRSFRPPPRTGESGSLSAALQATEEDEAAQQEERLCKDRSSSSGARVAKVSFDIRTDLPEDESADDEALLMKRTITTAEEDGRNSASLGERRSSVIGTQNTFGRPLPPQAVVGSPEHRQQKLEDLIGAGSPSGILFAPKVSSEPEIQLVIGMTPPVRLRMASADNYSARSMIVEWVEGVDGGSMRWNSSEDPLQNGWFEVEKLLPPHVRDIRVMFQVKGPGKRWDIGRVDRHRHCAWVPGEKEEIRLRSGDNAAEPVDAVFELKGPPHRCFVHRAWNAAAELHDEWECWIDDDESRPPREDVPQTLRAADLVVPPQECDTLEVYFSLLTKRLCVAAAELITVHRETLLALIGLDGSCTNQWLSTNVGTTASAGLMVAAVPMTFVLPPVGLTLAVAGGVAGGAAMGSGSIQERWTLQRLRTQLSRDAWNSFVVGSVLASWIEAGKALSKRTIESGDDLDLRHGGLEAGKDARAKGAAVAITTGAVGTDTALRTGVIAAASLGDEAAIILPVLGPAGLIVGAVLTTGIALHGWTQRRFSQQEVRTKLDELRSKILFFQCLLARLGRLDCSACKNQIQDDQQIRRCTKLLHCFHASCCIEASEKHEDDAEKKREEGELCPKCGFALDALPCTLQDIPEGLGKCLETVQNADKVSAAKTSSRFSAAEIRSRMSSMLPRRPTVALPSFHFGRKEEGPAYITEEEKSDLLDGETCLWELMRQIDAVSVLLSSDEPEDEGQVDKVTALLLECTEAEDRLKKMMNKMTQDDESQHEGQGRDLVVQITSALELLESTRRRFDEWQEAMPEPMGKSPTEKWADRVEEVIVPPYTTKSCKDFTQASGSPQLPARTSSSGELGEASKSRMDRMRLTAESTRATVGTKLTTMKGAFAEKAASAKQGMLSSMARKKDQEASPLTENAESGHGQSPREADSVAGNTATEEPPGQPPEVCEDTLTRVRRLLDSVSTAMADPKPSEETLQQVEHNMRECVASKDTLEEMCKASAEDSDVVKGIEDTLQQITTMSSRFGAWKSAALAHTTTTGSGGTMASAFSRMRGYGGKFSQAMSKPKANPAPADAKECPSTAAEEAEPEPEGSKVETSAGDAKQGGNQSAG